ncbi:MAG: hypothetical protein NTW86_23390 [Candidatus Sumerlaeota bacterium]|nr:hypothetical protein [Candidatus Sumerlaeota bacterium]
MTSNTPTTCRRTPKWEPNPTWWCIDPKGPTFEREGEAPLSRDLKGELLFEAYGGARNSGYKICAYHPAVRAANDKTLEQFTQEYPSDVLFEDQIGARRFVYDMNPAAPTPYAYLQGIHEIARADCRRIPLGTEQGHDRLINFETMFCGLSEPWLPNRTVGSHVLYSDLWPAEAFRVEPMAAYLAHDKVLFNHHDLGMFVRDRADLVWTLAYGFGLSFWLNRPPDQVPDVMQWIDCLSRVQRAVAARYAGQPLDEFEYVNRRVIKSRWGDLEMVVNLGSTPYAIDDATAVAPEGFYAKGPEVEAGILARYANQDHDPAGWWLIREKANNQWEEWTFAGERPGAR